MAKYSVGDYFKRKSTATPLIGGFIYALILEVEKKYHEPWYKVRSDVYGVTVTLKGVSWSEKCFDSYDLIGKKKIDKEMRYQQIDLFESMKEHKEFPKKQRKKDTICQSLKS